MYFDKKQLNSRRSSVRNSLKNERERARDVQKKSATDILRRAENQASTSRKSMVQTALLFGTAELSGKVLTSFGVTAPVVVSELHRSSHKLLTAFTNFSEIRLSARTEGVNVTDMESLAEYIFSIKGAVYHEGGHILYTTPLKALWESVRMQLTNMPDHPLAQRIEALNRDWTVLQRCWNIIEDQRMEMAMVTVSPVLATYFTSIVLNVVIDRDHIGHSWPYVTGRNYLDYDLRKAMRAEVRKPEHLAIIKQIDSVVARYRVADTHMKMLECVVEFYDLMYKWGLGSEEQESQHSRYGRPGDSPVQPMPEMDGNPPEYPDDQQQADDQQQPDGQQPGEGDGGEESEGESSQEQSSDSGSASSSGGDGDGEDEDEGYAPASSPTTQTERASSGAPSNGTSKDSKVDELIKQTLEKIKPKVTGETMTFATMINEEIGKSLPRDPTGRPMDAKSVANGTAIKSGVIAALEHLIDQTSPSWRFRQEMGILDPTAFVLREPGDTDYWSGLDDMGAQGYDLAVSVVLDTSYSMEYQMVELSEAALGIRLACDELEIPCDVSTFNTGEYALYRAEDKTVPTSVRADGGTSPAGILSMLDSQRYGKRRHLVVILTDGEWSNAPSLAPFSAAGRFFLLIGLNMWDPKPLINKGPNAHAIIREVNELPKHFTRALAGFLA